MPRYPQLSIDIYIYVYIYDTKTYTNISQTKCIYIYIACTWFKIYLQTSSNICINPNVIDSAWGSCACLPAASFCQPSRSTMGSGHDLVTAGHRGVYPPGALPRTCPSFVGSKFVLAMRHALEQFESSICAKKIASYALQCCIPSEVNSIASRLASGIWWIWSTVHFRWEFANALEKEVTMVHSHAVFGTDSPFRCNSMHPACSWTEGQQPGISVRSFDWSIIL